jgi:hypothetical protein
MNICSKYEITEGKNYLCKIKIKLWLNLNNLENIHSDYWNKQLIKIIYMMLWLLFHLEPFWYMQSFGTRHQKLDGPMTTTVCDVWFKCKISLYNYKYLRKQKCFQTSTMLCIQFRLSCWSCSCNHIHLLMFMLVGLWTILNDLLYIQISIEVWKMFWVFHTWGSM